MKQTGNVDIINPDGTTSSIRVYRTPEPGAPVVMVYPAMGMKAAYYAHLAAALADNGLNAVTADLRGTGNSGVRPSRKLDFGYREMIEQDLHSSVQEAKKIFPESPVFLLGHSLGGQLACLYTSRALEKIDGLILIACCSVYYGGWEGISKYRILIGTQFIGLVSSAVGYFPGRRLGFGGLNARTVMQDWSRQSRTGRYEVKNDDFNYEAALAELRAPVLSISFEGDDLAPPSAIDHLCGKFSPDAPVRRIHLGKDDPLNERYNHFNWPKRPDSIVRLINEWMRETKVF